ncbi:MAG: HIRAN domain-containing protein [Chloroflexota bacterium]
MTQPSHRPPRQAFVVHAGSAEERAILPEWWGALDSDIESRRLRFDGDQGTWLPEDDLPALLEAAGCRLSDVVGVSSYDGLTHRSLEIGQRVLLRPEPANVADRNAIAVWIEDGSQQVGYLPRDVAAQVTSEAQRRRAGYGAFVACEQRETKSRERRGLTILLGPGVIWAKPTA